MLYVRTISEGDVVDIFVPYRSRLAESARLSLSHPLVSNNISNNIAFSLHQRRLEYCSRPYFEPLPSVPMRSSLGVL